MIEVSHLAFGPVPAIHWQSKLAFWRLDDLMNSKSTISNAIVGDVEPLLQGVNTIQARIQLRYGTWCVYINTYFLTLPISVEIFHPIDTFCPFVPHDPIYNSYNSELNYCILAPSTSPFTLDLGPKTHRFPRTRTPKLGSPLVRIALVELQKKPD